MIDVLELPFDQYQRYELVRALLESVRAEGETFHVLDVGGRTALLREFLPGDRVDLVDVDPSDAEGLVLGSGAELPFQDGAFDAVCAFDTLEHVPPPLRDAFVAECARVARRYVILAGPYDAPRVAEAEQILLDFLKVRLGWEHRYLAEHRINGLPDMDATRGVLEGAGANVAAIGHGALDRWLALMSVELYVEHEALLREFAKRVYRFYNENLFRSDHGPEVYRHAVVAAFGGAPLPALEDALDPPGSAPAEADRTLLDLSREILRYDALRDTYRPEMERLHTVVAGIEKDRDEQRASLEAVSADLRGHRETLAALRAQHEEYAAARDTEADVIKADLEGHRAMLSELQEQRERELAEIDARGRRIEDLGQELEEMNARLGDAHGRIDDAEARVEDAHRQIASKEEIERQLRVEIERLERANASLMEDAQRLWNRIGRTLTFRRVDVE